MEQELHSFIRSQSEIKPQARYLKNPTRVRSPIIQTAKIKDFRQIYNEKTPEVSKSLKPHKRNYLTSSYSKFPESRIISNKISLPIQSMKSNQDKISLINTQRPIQYSKSSKMVESNMKSSISANQIGYDITKAKSDLLELQRDLSLYEDSFSKTYKVNKIISSLSRNSQVLKATAEIFMQINTFENLPSSINQALATNYLKKPKTNNTRIPCVETFSLMPAKIGKSIEKFTGIINLSGIRCLMTITSKLKRYHYISCLIHNQKLTINFDKNLKEIPDNYETFDQFAIVAIIPYLWLKVSEGIFSLHLKKALEKNERFEILKIKGLGLATVHLTISPQHLSIEISHIASIVVIELSHISSLLAIPLESSEKLSENILTTHFSMLKSLLQDKVIFLSPNLNFIESGSTFDHKEKSSKFLNNDFLLNAFESYRKKLFTFHIRIKGRNYKISGFANSEIRISYQKSSILLSQHTKSLTFLHGLQSDSLLKYPKTLQKSLELQHLLINLFKHF